MLGGSSGRDSPSPAAAAVTEQAPMSVASSNPGSNPESSPRQQTSPMDATTQHTNGIESSDPKPSTAPVATDTSTANSPIPSRTSSRADKQSTLEKSQETTNHDPEGTLRGSRRSILNRGRDKSSGSSRRSRRRNQDSANMEPKAATNPEVREPPAPEKKSRGSSKFLSIFCCCPSSGIDADETIPPAKKTVRPTGPETQPTPEKVDVNTGDSSTVEPKEPNYVGEEKNVAVTSDQSQPTVEEERKPVSGEHDSQTAGEVPATSQHESPQEDSSQEKHDETCDSQEPQATPGATAAVDGNTASDTIVDTQQKSSQDDESSALAQVTEPAPDTDDHPTTTTPPSDTNMPPQEEEAAGLPINIPPPPPLGPEVQVAPHERPIKLLPPVLPHLRGRKCLVLDLDETLVHSSFKVLERADFTIPVEIEGQYHNIYVIKRPGVDEFMKRVGELFEVVVFTASVSKYGDPLLDQLDIHNVVHHRLFRDSCYNHQGNYVKDLSQIGRDLRETIIIDNSPTSYIFHPQHAIPISSWFSDAHDNELLDLIPLLEDLAGAQVRDVSLVLDISC